MKTYNCVCSYPYGPHLLHCVNHNADKQEETTTHYHVCVNTPGYLPDPDSVVYCETLAEAQAYAEEEARRIVDEQESDDPDPYERVPGTEHLGRVRLQRKSPHSLDLVVDVIECGDECCREEG